MESVPVEQLISDLENSFRPLMEKNNLDDIGIFEEEGQGDYYHLGYTVKKNERVYMVHLPFIKSEDGHLTLDKQEWIVETDDPNAVDLKGFDKIDDVFQSLFR
ncbi:hypothetical protein SAMN05192559_105133 [Halobacillus karajensis]|uniref:GK1464-like domain-containing protein n=1 Tax=Halobacillus karajensis TaxID=195088 RepID=A0A024P572_9BACI|nr:DUF5634 family protein [Halobacillus karajensis]CDQ20598.1 hypothetical protein BN982_02948 [Halobacillus karajensis]CDQ23933.1 hypothetical protein BN983_02189 [Halobacillus karajensis]CDQ27411.1 hypothetical protein BN981_01670 [Halobacillus karajensis]SEH89038.1 hypothetical protein SAMN05192559_105133 [Halobacillus karajensis]